MANTDAAFGLRPIRHFNGSPWNGATKKFLVEDGYGTSVFVGDPVVISGDAGSDDALGHYSPVNVIAGNTDAEVITGVVVSIDPILTDLSKTYIPTGTGGYVNVCVDTTVVYAIQDDGTAVMDGADIGGNALIVTGTGSTVTGLGAFELDAAQAQTANASYNCTVLGVHNVEGNALGINCIWEVLLNTLYNYDSVLGT
jgi:hypothetical protein